MRFLPGCTVQKLPPSYFFHTQTPLFKYCWENHFKLLCLTYSRIVHQFCQMIRSFKDKETEKLFQTGVYPALNQAQRSALRKLRILDATNNLQSLKIPSGNRLEKLKGDRDNQFSIAINMQWRICFRWENGDAFDVEVVDYH